jgi:plastocyanin
MLARLAVVVAAAVAVLLPSAAARADNPVLVATVGAGDGFNIAMRDSSGQRVTHVETGTYTIQVHDLSEIHNFHLLGPGVDEATPVEEKQDVTWTATFQDGTYRFRCDAHATVMKGTFTAGTVTTPPPATKLSASVGPGRKISLRDQDGIKLTLVTGATRVVVTVKDRSRTDNFRLRGPAVNKATGVRFRGRLSWKLTLKPGLYVYRSDKHKALRGTFTVTASA